MSSDEHVVTSSQTQLDTFDTQPLSSQDNTPPDEVNGDAGPTSWGQLIMHGVPASQGYDLVNEQYVVGRAKECDIILRENIPLTNRSTLWSSCSKQHFAIYAEDKSNGRYAFVKDLSSNGTLVNGEVVGKGKFLVLKSGDVISLVKKYNKAFMYVGNDQGDRHDAPECVTKKYRFLSDLGSGACGVVKQAARLSDMQKFACKIIEKTSLTFIHPSNSQATKKEVDIMARLNHPCVVKVMDVIDTERYFYIFMELVSGGDLYTYITRNLRLNEDHTKRLFYQIIKAVKYLHDNNIVHRDIKPENIMLSSEVPEDQIAKVTDFGLSKIIESKSMMQTLCGTPSYLAPEVLADLRLGQGCYSKAVDCWSIGVMLFVCLTGQPAFTDERKDTNSSLVQQIIRGNYKLKDKYWKDIPQARDLVTKFLNVNPEDRLTLEDALKHPWFQDDQMVEVDALLHEERKRTTEMSCEAEFKCPEPKRRKMDEEEIKENRADASTPLLNRSNPSLLDLIESTAADSPMDTTSLPPDS